MIYLCISGLVFVFLVFVLVMALKGKSVETQPRFVAVHHCVSCDVVLSRREEMYSDGVCPYCGYNSDSTICDTVKRVNPPVETKPVVQYEKVASEYLKAIYDHCADLESLENILRRDSKEAIAVAISSYRWKLFNRAMGIQKEAKE